MKIAISKEALINLTIKQLNTLFMFDEQSEKALLLKGVNEALNRCDYCFAQTPNKYYQKEGKVYFNPFHSGQYSIYLYFLSSSVFKLSSRVSTLADRIYYLNKALNSLDLFYEVEMPQVFFLEHPVGSVLGRATYGEKFTFAQNCTVGNNKGLYPTFGESVTLMSGAKVIGKTKIGNNVIVSANAYVKDTDIPDNSLVFGCSPHLIIKKNNLVE